MVSRRSPNCFATRPVSSISLANSSTYFGNRCPDFSTHMDTKEQLSLIHIFTKQSTNVDYFSFTESEEAPLPSEEDLQALKDAIAEAEAYDADNYTEDSYAALTSAVEDGKALLDNAEATKTQVLDATQAIKDEMCIRDSNSAG